MSNNADLDANLYCRICGGEAYALGTMGATNYARCRACGVVLNAILPENPLTVVATCDR